MGMAAGAPLVPALSLRRVPTPRCCEDTHGMPRPRRPASDCAGLLSLFPENSPIMGLSVPRPRRIVLVRHGQSEGNVDESAYTRVPDPRISLTHKGWQDAVACGRRIREMIIRDGAEDWKVYFYVSPYKRTLETLRGIGRAFEHERIAGVREEPRLREQDFGNFQDREKMRIEKAIRLRYGRFFYRFPNGESAADVYDRITGFRETLRADIGIGRFQPPGERTPNMNLVIVSHGLTLRVFLMRWYKWTVEQFEGLSNFGNGGMLVMQTGSGGRYSLLVHHSLEELREFGLTEAMLVDQEWCTGVLEQAVPPISFLLFLFSACRRAGGVWSRPSPLLPHLLPSPFLFQLGGVQGGACAGRPPSSSPSFSVSVWGCAGRSWSGLDQALLPPPLQVATRVLRTATPSLGDLDGGFWRQKTARPGELNYNWLTSGPSFFTDSS